MIITPEQAALTAQERFAHLLDLVRQARQDGPRIDTVERDRRRPRLALGHDLRALVIVSPVQYFLQLPEEAGAEHPGDWSREGGGAVG